MGNDMVNTRSEASVRRTTVAGLQAAEELVASYQQRLASTVLGAWEEHLPMGEALGAPGAAVYAASSSAYGHGERCQPHLVGHAQLHGAA